MQKICTSGFKISLPDKKAWEHYTLETPDLWSKKVLNGMINKATKTLLKNHIEEYKKIVSGSSITNDITIIMNGISVLEALSVVDSETQEVKRLYNREASEKKIAERDDPRTIEIWPNGFDIQDSEWTTLQVFYTDPEQTLVDFMENKLALLKEAFVREFTLFLMNDRTVTSIPKRADALITFVTARPGYKNRAQREA